MFTVVAGNEICSVSNRGILSIPRISPAIACEGEMSRKLQGTALSRIIDPGRPQYAICYDGSTKGFAGPSQEHLTFHSLGSGWRF